jgi:hypothetical protein
MRDVPPYLPLTAREWAARWGVSVRTARRYLRWLHERHGPRVVERRGRRGEYRATQNDLERAGRGSVDDVVTHDQLLRALEGLRRELG